MKKILLVTFILTLALSAFAYAPRSFYTQLQITDGDIMEYVDTPATPTAPDHDSDFSVTVTDVLTGDEMNTDTTITNFLRVCTAAGPSGDVAWLFFDAQGFPTAGNVPEGREFHIVLTYLGNTDPETNTIERTQIAPTGSAAVWLYGDDSWFLPLNMFEPGVQPNILSISSNPTGASIYLDEVDTGEVTPFDATVAGTYSVMLAGYTFDPEEYFWQGDSDQDLNFVGTPVVQDPGIPNITYPAQGETFEWEEEQSITITWIPGDGPTPHGYEVKWLEEEWDTQVGTTYDTPLLGDGEYTFQVRAFTNAVTGRSYSPVRVKTTDRYAQTDTRGLGEAASVTFEVVIDSAPPTMANLFFSEYIEGSSFNKAIEIFNPSDDPVDLSDYRVEAYFNGNSSAGQTLVMSGNLASQAVYVISHGSAAQDILDVADITNNSVANFNGDDALALIYIPTETIIDVFGEIGNDPGTGWPVAGINNATADQTLVRKPTITQGNPVNLGSFGTSSADSEWIVYPNNTFDYIGSHDYTPDAQYAATPVIAPDGGLYYSSVEVTITCDTDDSTIRYTLDGTDPTDTEGTIYTGPFTIDTDTTVKAVGYAAGYMTSLVGTATYSFPTFVEDIASLREGATDGTVYSLTGEAILTFQQSSRNQKYIQDDTAAILIDDNSGNITTTYDLYDGITGIAGTLNVYSGLMQFLPVADPGAATSTGNIVVPEIRTLDSLTSDDQAKLIKVMGLSVVNPTGNFSSNAQNLNVTDGVTTLTMRTFPSADYADTPIPTGAFDLTCLVGQYNADMQIGPRFLADFEEAGEYDIPEDVETSIGEGSDTVTISGGSANIVEDGVVPQFPNDNMIVMGEYVLELTGSGPWTVVFNTTAPWGAYFANGEWHAVANDDGTITFIISGGDKNVTVPIVLGDADPTLPVELSSFNAVLIAQSFVELTWISESETNLMGYRVYRNETDNPETALLITPTMIPARNTSTTQVYNEKDHEVFPNNTYYYWLEAADYGHSTFFGPQIVEVTGEVVPDLPAQSVMSNAYPNPFKANNNTNIDVSIKAGESGTVTIYNIVGQAVKSFKVNEGNHNLQWNGRDSRGNACSSGIYFYKLSTPSMNQTKKMVIVK